MTARIDLLSDPGDLAAALGARVRTFAAEAVAARGRFALALPGGSVIPLLARGLGPADGSGWHIFWADERCVPRSDPDRNDRLAQVELLPRLNLPPDHIHPAREASDPADAARAYATELIRHFGADSIPRFDSVLLGVGADGHIASLFPGDAALHETRRWVAPVFCSPKPPPGRITLTLPVLNQARHVLVVAAGAGKAGIVARILAPAPGQSPVPAQLLQPSAGDLNWLLDRAAAAQLPPGLLSPHSENQP